GPGGRRGGPSAPRRGRRSRAARREWRGTVSWEHPPTPDLLLQRERSGGALVIHVERDLERGQQLAAGLHPCRGDGCPGLALVRQREAHALDGRADGQALVEKAKGVLEELLPVPRRDRAGDQLARGAADLQMDVLLARIEAGEGGVGERRTDVQSGLAGPEARLRDGEGLADLGRQRRGCRRGCRWYHRGAGRAGRD